MQLQSAKIPPVPGDLQSRPFTALILLLFFFSGAFGLVYQLVWSRMMTQVFGSTALATGTVLAAFMTGLALGAWWFGRVSERYSNPLRLYAWLEFGIGITALLVHFLLQQINPLQVQLFEWFGAFPQLFAAVRFVTAFTLIAAPTVMMGATLPVLTRYLVEHSDQLGTRLGLLYAVNTAGAVTGVLLTGFVLIGALGIHAPVYGAVAGNLLAGLVAWQLSRSGMVFSRQEFSAEQPPDEPNHSPAHSIDSSLTWIILAGLGISGLTSFAYEVYWTRSLVFILGNSTYALSTMLSAFLTGIALGAYLVRYLMSGRLDRPMAFAVIQLLLGLSSALALPLLFRIDDPQALNQFLLQTSGEVTPLILTRFAISFGVMLVPAMLIGATFPLASQIAASHWHTTGASVGRVYAINTAGNVLGALLPGLVLLSWLGIQKGILVMAALNIATGLLILFIRLGGTKTSWAWRLTVPALIVAAVVGLSRMPAEFQFPSDGELERHQTLYYREGPLATTKVYWDPTTMERLMSVDGIVIGGTGFTEFKQLLLAHLPKLLIPEVSPELSIGLGSGILAGESLQHPDVRRIVGVEIEPSVIEGARWFERQNHAVLDDSRLAVINDDIGNYLRTQTATFQVISADEKTADDYASNGFSYSREYYGLLRDHLAPGGLVAQWVPTTLPPTQYRMVLNTFAQSFPHIQLWYFPPAYQRGPMNTILIGSLEEIVPDFSHMRREFDESAHSYRSLVSYGLTSAESLLPHFVADGTTLRDAVSSASVNSLDHPRYEFYQPWDYARDRQEKFVANHQFLLDLREAASEGFLNSLDINREQRVRLELGFAAEERYLLGFQGYLQGGSLTEMQRAFDSALKLVPWNDSLRSRIYAQYAYLASIQTNPAVKNSLLQRASRLYESR